MDTYTVESNFEDEKQDATLISTDLETALLFIKGELANGAFQVVISND